MPVADYRAWLDGALDADALNTPVDPAAPHTGTATRTLTNVGTRAMYYSSSATGFRRHQVLVTPAAVGSTRASRRPSRSGVTGPSGAQPLDDGQVTWLGANGLRVRIPVVLAR